MDTIVNQLYLSIKKKKEEAHQFHLDPWELKYSCSLHAQQLSESPSGYR